MNDSRHEGEADSSFAPSSKPLISLEKRIEGLEKALATATREGIIEGENEFARWLDRKGGAFTDGEVERAVNALQRYRMGRGW